jgi:hypothetical protein
MSQVKDPRVDDHIGGLAAWQREVGVMAPARLAAMSRGDSQT